MPEIDLLSFDDDAPGGFWGCWVREAGSGNLM
jgi:hypothetical protein